MTVALYQGGTQSAVTGTEHTLATVNVPGRFQLVVDTTNMAVGDVLQLRTYLMPTPSGTALGFEEAVYYGPQASEEAIKLSSPVPNDQTDAQALKFTLMQTYGVGRSFAWKVLNLEKFPDNFTSLGISPLGHVQNVDLVGQVTGSAMSLVSGASAGGGATAAEVWGYATRQLTDPQVFTLSGTITHVASVDGIVRANMLQIDGNATSGTNATLNLKKLVINPGSLGAAVDIETSGIGSSAPVFIKANEAGTPAVSIVGGAGNGGNAVQLFGGGHALLLLAGTAGNALEIQGNTGDGISLWAYGSGAAIRVNVDVGFGGNNLGYLGNMVGIISGSTHYGSIQGNLLGYVGQVTGSVMSVVSGTASSIDYSQVWSYTGSKVVDAVKGGFVTVSGTVLADVRSLVGISGTVVASAVQGGFVTVSGTVNLASPQVVNFIGNISGTVTNNYLREQEIETMIGLLKEDERAIVGSMFYVDGTRGNDVSGDGTRLNPFKTITRALIQVTSHAHDAIFLLPVPTGTNTITETGTVTISKADVQIYGPGYDVLVTNIPATNRDVFNITAEGVGLHQFRLTAAGNSSNGVTFSGGAALGLVSHLWIESVTQDGVFINVGNRNRIENSYIQAVGRDGVRISSGAGSGTYNFINNTVIRNNVGNGINLLGTDASNTRIQNNIIRDNIGFGVAIAAGTANTALTDNRIFNNTAGNLSDAGTNTLQQWNFFNTDTSGIPLAVYNVVSGSVIADRVWQYSGTRTVDYVRGLVGVSGTVVASAVQGGQVTVSGTVVASAVQGGFVTVSGTVVADVRSLVGVSGTVLASAVQSLVGVSGTVIVGQNNDKTGYSLSSPQQFDLIGNITGSMQGSVVYVVTGAAANIDYSQVWSYTGSKIVDAVKGGYVNASGVSVAIDYSQIWNYTGSKVVDAVKNGYVTVSGTVIAAAVQGGYVTVSGTVVADVRSLVGVSGTVIVGQNNDKTGYSLADPQRFNLIGNISGTITNVFNVISGTQATVNAADIWQYTGTKIVDAVKGGYVNASGVTANVDPSAIWNYTGTKVVDAVRGGFVSVSGTVIVASGTVNTVFNVVSGTAATIDYGAIWSYTGSRSLNGTQHWDRIGILSGTIMPPITAVATGVVIDYASIWGYATRTLTDQVFNLPPVEQGNNLNIRRGDTFSWSPTNLGSLANLSKLYFTVKRLFTDLDSESEVMVEKTAGLLYINRAAAANALHGSIVVLDAALGNITITVDASETAKLDLLTDVYYDVQFINTSGTVTTLVNGLVTIDGDATRGTS